MSLSEYARQVGRSITTISTCAQGYASWQKASLRGAPQTPISDYIQLANMGAERAAVTKAVAEARGVTAQTAKRHHADEIRHIRELAEERAEAKGSTVERKAGPRVTGWGTGEPGECR